MKSLKSSTGTFSTIDFLSSGLARESNSDNYTDVNDMTTTGIWRVSSASSNGMYVENLPKENTYGILIVLKYESSVVLQFYMTTDSPSKMYKRIRKSSGWGSWYLVNETEVTG